MELWLIHFRRVSTAFKKAVFPCTNPTIANPPWVSHWNFRPPIQKPIRNPSACSQQVAWDRPGRPLPGASGEAQELPDNSVRLRTTRPGRPSLPQDGWDGGGQGGIRNQFFDLGAPPLY